MSARAERKRAQRERVAAAFARVMVQRSVPEPSCVACGHGALAHGMMGTGSCSGSACSLTSDRRNASQTGW